jgi:TetR/AcrR family transcriptional regulator, copper-responsive repressor
MVQKDDKPAAAPKRRGRPRAYDPDAALRSAIKAFWQTGYSGTSLDDLAAATAMNRPSLYAAFGDKRALYLRAIDHYWQVSYQAMEAALGGEGPLAAALMRVYEAALSLYFSGPHPRGCFVIGTATTEAVEQPDIRAAMGEGLRELDTRVEARVRAAHQAGELPQDADPAVLAFIFCSVMHSFAVRARSGTPRAELEDMARKTVALICGD